MLRIHMNDWCWSRTKRQHKLSYLDVEVGNKYCWIIVAVNTPRWVLIIQQSYTKRITRRETNGGERNRLIYIRIHSLTLEQKLNNRGRPIDSYRSIKWIFNSERARLKFYISRRSYIMLSILLFFTHSIPRWIKKLINMNSLSR